MKVLSDWNLQWQVPETVTCLIGIYSDGFQELLRVWNNSRKVKEIVDILWEIGIRFVDSFFRRLSYNIHGHVVEISMELETNHNNVNINNRFMC